MLSNLCQTGSLPVLEEVVKFAQARHNVLAGNIANISTPGYETRDLSVEEFQTRLKQAIDEQHNPTTARSPGEPDAVRMPAAKPSENAKTILRHDKNNVSIEQQVSEMVKNQVQHNLALAIMTDQFRLLETAISGRV